MVKPPRVLLLGGTSEASALAAMLAQTGIAATLSYAGCTRAPRAQPVPVRIGGFGGVTGLVEYVREHRITHLVDATHPFASRMSHHAALAATQAGVPLAALTRAAWQPAAGDQWETMRDIAQAVAALAQRPPARVFLALGRLNAAAFAAAPQHHYLLRFVDAPQEPVPLDRHRLIIDRGPFTLTGDLALMRDEAIDLVVSKNAGGHGARAKLDAARELGAAVLMIARPPAPERLELHDPASVIEWLAHTPPPSRSRAERGV